MIRFTPFLLLAAISSQAAATFPDRPTTEFKSVGMIGTRSSTGFKISGSGVAIAPRWVISVSHVGGKIFVQEGVEYAIERKVVYKARSGDNADLALFHLSKAAKYIAPVLAAKSDPIGEAVWLVGYGQTATIRPDGRGWKPIGGSEGVRRAAHNRIDQRMRVRSNLGSTQQPKWVSQISLVYDLDNPEDSTMSTIGSDEGSNDGGLAAKDSGGGWFVRSGRREYLVAISSNVGIPAGSQVPDKYAFGAWGFGIELSPYRAWIDAVLAST